MMLGAGRDQLLNLILSNGLANRSFMAYNFPGYVQVHSTKVINGKKIEEIGYFSLLWMISDENRSYTGIFFLLEGVLAIRHLCIVTSEAAHIFTA